MFHAVRLYVLGIFSNAILVIVWFLLGFGYLVLIIYSAEYPIEQFGEPRSWKLSAKTKGLNWSFFGNFLSKKWCVLSRDTKEENLSTVTGLGY